MSSHHRRLDLGPGRDDNTTPYARQGAASVTRSTYLGDQTAGTSAYRWTLGLGGEPDLSKPYAQHPWVYACVSAISRAASSVPARLNRELPNGEYREQTDTPLARMFGLPNPIQSQRKFFRAICTSQQLYGETFLILLKRAPDGRMVPVDAVGGHGMMAMIEPPDEVWPVRGDLVDAVMDPVTKLPAAWRFNTTGGGVEYPAHAVVQVAEVNPYNPLRGMGPMQAAYRTAAKDFTIDRYDEALLQNGGSPGGVLSVDGPLTDADQRAIREAWQEAHGRPDQHRKTAVLPQGTEYKEIGMTPQAMEHEKLRDWDRQTILSIFGVPPVVLGLETINYATAREQNRIFWETTVLPYLDFLRDEIQHKLIRRINSPDRELMLDFDITGVSALREDMDAKVERTLKLYEKGHRSFQESAILSGWDVSENDLQGVDERYVPVNLQPAEIAQAQGAGGDGGAAQRDADHVPTFETRAEFEQVRDEVYATWRSTVNMSATELERWGGTECSRKASLDPGAVIDRNLRLLRTKKADWDARDVRDANRTISFVSRMRGMPKGEPVSETCPSKRDISLRNWAYNPDKRNRSADDVAPEVVVAEPEVQWPDALDTEDKRMGYWKQYTEEQDATIAKVAKRTERVYRDMLLSVRKTLKGFSKAAPTTRGAMVTKAFTDAELERLLKIDVDEWGAMLAEAIQPLLERAQVTSAGQLAGEIGVGATITTVEDPFIVAFYKDFPVYLAEGPTSTLAYDVRRAILAEVLNADIGSVNSLRAAIELVLEEAITAVDVKMAELANRADRIARTETIKAYNGARAQEMVNNGVEQHQWLSSRDKAVRDSHRQLDGRVVKVGDPFKSGLTFPGDRSADAAEVVNCRCTTVPIIKPKK